MPTVQAQLMRVLIIDDEPHARAYLCELLGTEPDLVIVGEAASGVEGVELIRRLSPDLVFLDIQMPGSDGFDVVERLGTDLLPMFVLVTGYSKYAVRAFEIEAVDYLCKPFDKERLSVSLERAVRRSDFRHASVERKGSSRYWSRLSIKEEDGIVMVPVDRILWIEAANKYVVIHTIDQKHILRQTIQNLEDNLDPKQFVRIHRSTLVRKAAVRGVHPLFHGDYLIKLTNGVELTLSRSFRGSFFQEISH